MAEWRFQVCAMTLKPTLGPVQLLFYCVGVIVGAGVYSIIGPAAGLAGQGVWLGFVVAAIVALLTGFSYAEMATSFPHAGAEYVYVKRAFPGSRFLPLAVGIMILIGGAATASTVAVAFGGYMRSFINIPIVWSALALMAFCTLFNMWGLRESSWLNILFTCIEVSGLLLIIAAGMAWGNIAAPLAAGVGPGLLPAAAVLFFVFLGFEEIANMAEEIRDPPRHLPRAIFLSIAITTFLYVLVSLSVTTLASPAELAASTAPLALAIEKVWPEAGGPLSAIALFATANTVLITLIAASRLSFSLARDHEIPAIFAQVSAKRNSPRFGAMLTFVLAAAFLPLGDLKLLAELSSFVALLAFLAVNVTLIVLRFRLPDHPRPFRVPFQIGRVPIIPVLAIASIAVLLASFDYQVYLAGAVVGILISLASLWRAFKQDRAPAARQLRTDEREIANES
jgi:APA family basic amino acid/polyamine antiporter